MSNYKFLFLGFVFCLTITCTNAQVINWSSFSDSKRLVAANLGLDHSLSLGVGYSYRLNKKSPFLFNTELSLPFGNTVLDDFKTKIGAQFLLLNNGSFKGILSLQGIYRRYQNSMVRMQNFGSEAGAVFGYYRTKGFIAAQVGFDKAIVTHLKHSSTYREDVYADVIDGWYGPATGGNVVFGIQTGYSFKRQDLTLSVGRVLAQDFRPTPLLPFSLKIGWVYKKL